MKIKDILLKIKTPFALIGLFCFFWGYMNKTVWPIFFGIGFVFIIIAGIIYIIYYKDDWDCDYYIDSDEEDENEDEELNKVREDVISR